MPIIVSEPEGSSGPRILPPDGLQPAICVDVVDQGEHENTFNGTIRQKVSIHFLLGETIPSKWKHPKTGEVVEVSEKIIGLPFGVSRWFTRSLFELAALRIFLKTWRGKDFTEEECQGFDLETLIGVPAALNIVYNHSENTGKWYANIEGVSRLPAAWEAPKIPKDYIRIKDRETRDDKGNGQNTTPPKKIQATTETGYGPDYDFDSEPIPSDDGAPDYSDDSLPF